ncbi:HD domain-containing protein [bacterium]|nr:HD domain-containing protein [bacterium]
MDIWDEFEERKTRELKFVFQVEKLEMAIQAKIYEGQYKKDLSEFQTYVERIIEDDCLKELFQELQDLKI